MSFQFTPYFPVLIFGAVVSLALAIYAWRRRATQGGVALTVMFLIISYWTATYALELAGAGLATKLFWAKIEYLGIASSPVVWLAFTLDYTGRGRWLTSGRLVLLSSVPLITTLLAFTNEQHGLIWSQVTLHVVGEYSFLDLTHGLWFWINLAYTYVLCIIGVALIAAMGIRRAGVYRRQAIIVLIGGFVPLSGNVLSVTPLNPFPHLDLTPLAFTLSGPIMAWGLFRFRMLDLVPIARDAVIEAMQDGLLILDMQDRIVDVNPAVRQIVGLTTSDVIGRPAGEVLGAWAGRLQPAHMAAQVQNEIDLNGRDYELRVSPLPYRRDRPAGRLIILRDITSRKRIERELRTQKQLLEDLVAVARATTEQPALEATLNNVLNVGIALTGAERGRLFLLDGHGHVTQAIAPRNERPDGPYETLLDQVTDRGLVSWVAHQRQGTLIGDTSRDPRWWDAPGQRDTRSVLVAPILSGRDLLGVLILQHSRTNHFSEVHLQLMRSAADQMVMAVRNAQSYDAQRRMADRQTTLYEVLRTVGSQLDPDAVVRTAAEATARFAGWPNVVIAMPQADWQRWEIRAAGGEWLMSFNRSLPIDHGIIGRTFATGQTQYAPDVSVDPNYVVGRPGTRSELAVPLRRAGRILGVLNIESDQTNAFDVDEVSLAESLADAIALALDNASLYQAIADERSRLEALIRSSREGIILLSLDRRVLVINETALRFLRLPDQPDDWLGRPLVEALLQLRHHAPAAVRTTLSELRRLNRGDESPGEGEFVVPPQTLHWFNLPVLSGEAPVGRLLVLRDVTEERSLETQREDLTRTMVHDLRNPLTVIQGSMDLLEAERGGSLTGEQRDTVGVARRGVQRMLDIISAILDVSQLETGQMPLACAPVKLRSLAASVVRMQSVLATEKHLRLENAVPADLPAVNVDIELMQRVLQNLIGNAIKFTPSGGSIETTAAVDPTRPAWVVVSVSDTGSGIPPELQAHLFQKFVTGPVRGRGSGLGLAFCRLAVEAHGGRIWVDSQPGRGAVFSFTLPVVPSDFKKLS